MQVRVVSVRFPTRLRLGPCLAAITSVAAIITAVVLMGRPKLPTERDPRRIVESKGTAKAAHISKNRAGPQGLRTLARFDQIPSRVRLLPDDKLAVELGDNSLAILDRSTGRELSRIPNVGVDTITDEGDRVAVVTTRDLSDHEGPYVEVRSVERSLPDGDVQNERWFKLRGWKTGRAATLSPSRRRLAVVTTKGPPRIGVTDIDGLTPNGAFTLPEKSAPLPDGLLSPTYNYNFADETTLVVTWRSTIRVDQVGAALWRTTQGRVEVLVPISSAPRCAKVADHPDVPLAADQSGAPAAVFASVDRSVLAITRPQPGAGWCVERWALPDRRTVCANTFSTVVVSRNRPARAGLHFSEARPRRMGRSDASGNYLARRMPEHRTVVASGGCVERADHRVRRGYGYARVRKRRAVSCSQAGKGRIQSKLARNERQSSFGDDRLADPRCLLLNQRRHRPANLPRYSSFGSSEANHVA